MSVNIYADGFLHLLHYFTFGKHDKALLVFLFID